MRNDRLDGREGSDTFMYTLAPSASGVDHIDDFALGEDQIELNGFVFGHLAAGELSASAFVLGSAAADADDRIIYDGQTGTLYFDLDGNGVGTAVAFATLSAGFDFAASNFVILWFAAEAGTIRQGAARRRGRHAGYRPRFGAQFINSRAAMEFIRRVSVVYGNGLGPSHRYLL